VRCTTLLRHLVGVTALYARSVRMEGAELLVEVRPRRRKPRCGRCGQRAPGYDRARERRWRHLGLGSIRLSLCYTPRRVECAGCGIRTEQVPWAAAGSRFTKDFEEMVAYLARVTDKTQVTRLMGISWRTVGEIVERVVARKQEPERLSNLRWIGVDEFSHRKGQRYLTLVVDHEKRRVVWAAEGRDAATLRRFFEELGPEKAAEIEGITTDLAGWNLKAIEEHIPDAQVVFDRFSSPPATVLAPSASTFEAPAVLSSRDATLGPGGALTPGLREPFGAVGNAAASRPLGYEVTGFDTRWGAPPEVIQGGLLRWNASRFVYEVARQHAMGLDSGQRSLYEHFKALEREGRFVQAYQDDTSAPGTWRYRTTYVPTPFPQSGRPYVPGADVGASTLPGSRAGEVGAPASRRLRPAVVFCKPKSISGHPSQDLRERLIGSAPSLSFTAPSAFVPES